MEAEYRYNHAACTRVAYELLTSQSGQTPYFTPAGPAARALPRVADAIRVVVTVLS